MSNLVKHGSYEIEAAEAEQEDIDRSGSADFMKLEVGRNVIRVLPPAAGKKSPFKVIYQHYLTPPGAAGPVVFTCPRMQAKQPCPVCVEADRFKRSGNPIDRDRAYDLFPSRRVFANVINRRQPEKGPQVLDFGKTIHEALIKLRRDEIAGGDYTDPVKGFDIVIERTGTSKNDTKYDVLPARTQSPLGDDSWIENQHDLERFAAVKTEDEIREAVGGEAPSGRGHGQQESRGRGESRQLTSGDRGGSKPKARTAEDDALDVT